MAGNGRTAESHCSRRSAGPHCSLRARLNTGPEEAAEFAIGNSAAAKVAGARNDAGTFGLEKGRVLALRDGDPPPDRPRSPRPAPAHMAPEPVIEAIYRFPIAFIVLRTMLGFTPPEWAYVATERADIEISQGAARSIDRKIRAAPETPMKANRNVTDERIHALVVTACQLLTEGAPKVPKDILHRLDKADTKEGTISLQHLADFGAPYAMLLYERFLGRSFAADPSKQIDVFDFPDLGITVVGFCSCHNNDLLNRQAVVHSDCIAEAGNRLRDICLFHEPLRIAVWHHSTEGPP